MTDSVTEVTDSMIVTVAATRLAVAVTTQVTDSVTESLRKVSGVEGMSDAVNRFGRVRSAAATYFLGNALGCQADYYLHPGGTRAVGSAAAPQRWG
jgi:hypothetical protein